MWSLILNTNPIEFTRALNYFKSNYNEPSPHKDSDDNGFDPDEDDDKKEDDFY